MAVRFIATWLTILLLAGSTLAQPCHAENDGNTYQSNVTTGGPNLLIAIKMTAPSSLLVSAIEVFTGLQTGINTLALWSHNVLANAPQASLGSGQWSMSSMLSWQGAGLTTPVALSAGATYWVVWGCQNGSQSSIDVVGPQSIIQQYRGSFNGGTSWNGPFASYPWKFRFTCASMGWQINQAAAVLDINGVQSNGSQPAVVQVPAGQPAMVTFGGMAGAPWDLGHTTNASLVPYGFVTPQGQIVNLDIAHPTFGWLYGGTFQNTLVPFTAPITIPVPGVEIDAQMIVVTPSQPEGVTLSQAVGLQSF